MQDYFDSIWYSSGSVPLEQIHPSLVCWKPSKSECKLQELGLVQTDHTLLELDSIEPSGVTADCWQENQAPVDLQRGLAENQQLTLWYDRTIKKTDRTMACQVERLVDSAQLEVCIESPYPAFTRSFSACLRRAARRGVRVLILTNSISSTDQILTHAAYQNQKAIWLAAGVDLFEYNGPDHLHSKKMIVDNCIAWVGSYNFDARSERLNLELVLQVTDPVFVDALSESMQQRKSLSSQACNLGCANVHTASLVDRSKLRLFQTLMPILRPLL
jgi:phosphatidylserine/phosphatidylglycerophosphate/cardiolipin synthase-like enzyme